MEYLDYIDILRWIHRCGFIFVAVSCWILNRVVNLPVVSLIFKRLGIYFLVWAVGGIITLVLDIKYLSTWSFILALHFNFLMVYGLAVLILLKARDIHNYEKSPQGDKPSDIILETIRKIRAE